MALFDFTLKTRRGALLLAPLKGIALSAGLAAALAAFAPGSDAHADFPGEFWSIGAIKVAGDATDEQVSTVIAGLRRANETYFYGDRPTRMIAITRGEGTVDLSIIDNATDQTIAQKRSVKYDDAGSLTNAALAWMEGLTCSAACASLPQTREAPVQVARVPVETKPAAAAPTRQAKRAAKPKKPRQTRQAKPRKTAKPRRQQRRVAKKDPAPRTRAAAAPKPAAVAAATPQTGAAEDTPAVSTLSAIEPKPATRSAAAVATGTPSSGTPSTGSADTAPNITASAPAEPSTGDAASPVGELLDGLLSAGDQGDTAPAVAATPAPAVAAAAPSTPSGSATATGVAGITASAEAQPSVSLPTPRPAAPAEPATTIAAVAPQDDTDVSAAQETEVAVAVTEPTATRTTQPARAVINNNANLQTDTSGGAEAAVSVPSATAQPSNDPVASITTTLSNPAATTQPGTTTTLPQPQSAERTAALAAEAERAEEEAAAAAAAAAAAQQPELPTPSEPGATEVETRIAAVDPKADTSPTLANARWVGFTPAVYTGSDDRSGTWISGPFDRKERTGWITDTATGATTRVTFIWREGGRGGRTATLSRAAAQKLGLGQGDVANVAVYLPR